MKKTIMLPAMRVVAAAHAILASGSGEAQWPAQIHDSKAAIRRVRATAETYGIDPDLIGIIGSSAGGHLVAVLGTSCGVDALEGDVGADKGTSSKVACVIDEFGPSDILTMGGPHNDAGSPSRP
jgi:acetyl esterase/lipase